MTTTPTLPEVFEFPGGAAVGVRYRWAGMSAGSVGQSMSRPEYQWKNVQVTGELADGDLEGTNTPEIEESWMPIVDNHGARLDRPGLYRVEMNTLAIRPVVRDGEHVAFDIVATK